LPLWGSFFTALADRAHNLRRAYAPRSVEGATRHAERFNPRSTPALYLALAPKIAWMGALRGIPFKAQLMVLVGYCVDCGVRRVMNLCRRRFRNSTVGTGMPTHNYILDSRVLWIYTVYRQVLRF
jgi:RES domain-containing protein